MVPGTPTVPLPPRRAPGHLEGSGWGGSQAKMLPMLAAKMMARMMQHSMIMIFFCTGREGP